MQQVDVIFIFWPHCGACRPTRDRSHAPALEMQSLNTGQPGKSHVYMILILQGVFVVELEFLQGNNLIPNTFMC